MACLVLSVHLNLRLFSFCSIKSTFQLRTFDPEGAIFYGDTKQGADWFVLALKDGIPLIEICKGGSHISVAGGSKLNDGKWHTVSFQCSLIYRLTFKVQLFI